MEHRRIAGQAAQHGPQGIGGGRIETGMGQQAPDPLQPIGDRDVVLDTQTK